MSDQKVTSTNDQTIWDALKEAVRDIDAKAWPGVLMFLALIVIEATANVIVSIPDFGWIVALGVGMLFGVFMGAWHILTERERNSIKQQSTAEFVVNLVGGLAIALFVVNLIRLMLSGDFDWSSEAWAYWYPTVANIGGWDVLAILIVGVAFTAHLYGYLTWHKADTGRADRRAFAADIGKVQQKEQKADLAVRSLEAELKSIDAELREVQRLEKEYAHLPAPMRDQAITRARKKIRDTFEEKYDVDLDGDGKIGGKQTSTSVQKPSGDHRKPQDERKPYTLAEFLEAANMTKNDVLAYKTYQKFAAFASQKFEISGRNMKEIWRECGGQFPNPTGGAGGRK